MASFLPFFGTGTLILSVALIGKQAVTIVTTPQDDLNAKNSIKTELSFSEKSKIVFRKDRSDIYYSAITERPLFAPTRRPVSAVDRTLPDTILENVAPVEASAPEALKPPQLALHGVMNSLDHLSALLSLNDSTPEWFSQGAVIQGWNLGAIGDDWVILTRNEHEHRVDMY